MRTVLADGSPAAVEELVAALAAALDGGPPVAPIGVRIDRSMVDPLPDPGGAGAALVIETSGSTGEAKRVVLSAAALRAATTATHSRLGGPGRWLLALPAHHIAGAAVIVRAVLTGERPAVLDLRAGFTTAGFAAAASALFDTALPVPRHYTSLVPTQLHRVLADGGAGLAALRGFDAVLVGGAATSPTLLAEARAAGVAVVTTYGTSETAGGCVYDGVPLDGVRVHLADGGDEDGIGLIWLAGPTLASGYLGRPELTAESFLDGWFRTSDLGRWGPDGRLAVLGRADDVITTGGESVHPASVERVLTGQPGVRAACVVGLDNPEWGQLLAAALVAGPAGPDLEQLRAAVRAQLGAPSVPRLLRVLDELPMHGVGKPDRAAVARLLR